MRKPKPEKQGYVLNEKQLGTVGKAGEDAACRLLTETGVSILARNVRYGRKEIDVVATYGEHILFIEVKTRTIPENPGKSRFGAPSNSIDADKKKNLIEAARYWLEEHPAPSMFPRMDVIEVILKPSSDDKKASDPEGFEVVSIKHFENAFGMNF